MFFHNFVLSGNRSLSWKDVSARAAGSRCGVLARKILLPRGFASQDKKRELRKKIATHNMDLNLYQRVVGTIA